MNKTYLACFPCTSFQFYSFLHYVQCAFCFCFSQFNFKCTCLLFVGKSDFSLARPTKLAEMPKDTPILLQLLMCASVWVGPLRQRARTRSRSRAAAEAAKSSLVVVTHTHARTHTQTPCKFFSFLCFFGIFCRRHPPRCCCLAFLGRKCTRKLVNANIGWKNALTVAVVYFNRTLAHFHTHTQHTHLWRAIFKRHF